VDKVSGTGLSRARGNPVSDRETMAGRAEAKSQVFFKKKGARPGTYAMDMAGRDLRTLCIQFYGR
jgi:hypothetical protein